MQVITLEATPNQTVSVLLDLVRYRLTFKQAGDMMAVTIIRNDVEVLSGSRCVAGTPLLPYAYLEGDGGNFMFVSTEDGLIPFWADFGSRTQLTYATAAELAVIRATA